SLGLVCFGSSDLVYHRMICPQDRLNHSLWSALASAADFYGSAARMSAALKQQDAALRLEFQFEPIKRLFERAARARHAARPVTKQIQHQAVPRIRRYCLGPRRVCPALGFPLAPDPCAENDPLGITHRGVCAVRSIGVE